MRLLLFALASFVSINVRAESYAVATRSQVIAALKKHPHGTQAWKCSMVRGDGVAFEDRWDCKRVALTVSRSYGIKTVGAQVRK